MKHNNKRNTGQNRLTRLAFTYVAGAAVVVLLVWVRVTSRMPLGAVVPVFGHAVEANVSLPSPLTEDSVRSILFVGDIMLGRGVAGRLASAGGAKESFAHVRDIFLEYDYVVANLEGPVSDRGTNVGSRYSFRFPSEAARWVADAGIDLVSTANNHAWDYGRVALCDTIDHLSAAGVASVGTGCDEVAANRPHEVVIGDSRFLFLSYTNLYPSSLTARGEVPGVSDLSQERIASLVEEFLSRGPGVVVALMHWGEEYEMRSHPLQQGWAYTLIDLGVDVVIGHHPHVTQEIERYGDGWIVYSLGNFIFDQYFSKETMRGFGVAFRIRNNHVLSFSVLPYELNELYQPIFRESVKSVESNLTTPEQQGILTLSYYSW